MRRREREVTDREEILSIIRRCEVCHVAFHGEEYPYVVPMNFGFEHCGERLSLFFHGAAEGKKQELLRRNPKVAFVMENTRGFSGTGGDYACRCSAFYESVMGDGEISILEGEEKVAALHCLVEHCLGEPHKAYSFEPAALANTCVLRLAVHHLTAKRHLP